MVLYIDVPWLLDVQERATSEDLAIADYSALVAAVARHKTRMPTLETSDPDAAWRAAALLHTIARLEPLPFRNSLFAAAIATQYLHDSGEGVDPPYGALPNLVRKVRDERVSVYAVAEQLRVWRV
ncbi:toxin Doc [Streptomyces sp. SID14478]|uniref:toxin Doc n=1 Tax=Streptomyces sp. SID14478 TaxID=2706073 RepID=UPI0013DA1511|nr:toxin Doc [Streptomyces sp. SID14478]NEB75984.1 toxin Doc [Streptomyces sp. SID14478]